MYTYTHTHTHPHTAQDLVCNQEAEADATGYVYVYIHIIHVCICIHTHTHTHTLTQLKIRCAIKKLKQMPLPPAEILSFVREGEMMRLASEHPNIVKLLGIHVDRYCTATFCNALQRAATCCKALKRTATRCHTLRHDELGFGAPGYCQSARHSC